jgi:hypothetical protein
MGFSNRNVIFPVAFVIATFFVMATYRYSGSPRSIAPRPRFVFVDLGANRADSLEAFLQVPDSKFSYTFPRPDWAAYEDAGKNGVEEVELQLSLSCCIPGN